MKSRSFFEEVEKQQRGMNRSGCITLQWTKSQPAVWAFISSLVPNYQQAEEILQQVAVIAVDKYDDFDQSCSFTSWVIGIARYEILKSRRQVSMDRHSFYPFNEDLSKQLGLIYEEKAEDLNSRLIHMSECLKTLRGRAREALHLRYAKNMEPGVLAETFGVSQGTAYTILSRARDLVRRCIERRLAQEGQE